MMNYNGKKVTALAFRPAAGNRDHHLWRNHGIWWLHITVHLADGTKDRLRQSLKTRDVKEARNRRDKVVAALRKALAGSRKKGAVSQKPSSRQ